MSFTLYLLNEKGYKALLAILENDHLKRFIDQVVTTNDDGNQEDHCKEITSLCLQNDILVYDKNDSFNIRSEYSVAIGWRWMIKDPKNLIVIHDSILPKYRGFSPLPNMLINGEPEIGATAIFANARMDEGDIIFAEKTQIEYPLLIKDAINIVSEIYASLIIKIFYVIAENNSFTRIIQNDNQATYSLWRDYEDYFIDWTQNALFIKRFIDAVGFPYAGAKTRVNGGDIITVIRAEVVTNYRFEISSPGKIFMFEDGAPLIACGKNALKILEVKDNKGDNYEFRKLRIRLI